MSKVSKEIPSPAARSTKPPKSARESNFIRPGVNYFKIFYF